MPSLQSTYRLVDHQSTLCIRKDMGHGHDAGWSPPEIHVFADSVIKNEKPLPKIIKSGRKKRRAWLKYSSVLPVTKAEFIYTSDSGPWQKRIWHAENARIRIKKKKVSHKIPKGTKVYLINIYDERGLMVSSPIVDLTAID